MNPATYGGGKSSSRACYKDSCILICFASYRARTSIPCHDVPRDFLNLRSPTSDLQPLPKPPIPSNSNPIQNIITITTQQLNNTTYYANNNNKTKNTKRRRSLSDSDRHRDPNDPIWIRRRRDPTFGRPHRVWVSQPPFLPPPVQL